MQIITGTEAELKENFKNTMDLYLKTNDPLEKSVLYSRLDTLCRVMSAISKEGKMFRLSSAMRKEGKLCEGVLSFYNDGFVRNFIENKSFHNKYIGDMLDITNEELSFVVGNAESSNNCSNIFRKDDFYVVLFDFLKTMGLEFLFDDFIKNKKIFSKIKPYRPLSQDFTGLILHNPVNGDMSIVVDNFQYSLENMAVLAHEFGHVYDLGSLDDNDLCRKSTNYAYCSVLGECVSTMFEKSFYEYVIKNNIMTSQSKTSYEDLLFSNKDHLFASYIFTLLDDDYLKEEKYAFLQEDELFNLVSLKFDDVASLEAFISYKLFSLRNDLCYGYGEVMSLFLKDNINKEGFDNELMRDFMLCRTDFLNPNFMEKHNLNGEAYKKIYKQEIDLCKK